MVHNLIIWLFRAPYQEYQGEQECEKETGLVLNSLTGLYVHLVFGKNETIFS